MKKLQFHTSIQSLVESSMNKSGREIPTSGLDDSPCDRSDCLSASDCMFTKNVQLHAGGSGVRLYDGPDLKLFILVGWGRSFLSVAWPTGVQLVFFFCSGVSRLFGAQGSPSSGSLLNL